MQRIKDITIAVLVITLMWVWNANAGNPTGPGTAPDATSSYTVEDLYQRLDAGTAGTQSTFTEPSVAPGTGTMHTLNEVMDKAPAKDDTNGVVKANVPSGKTFWGLNAASGEWGLQTGTANVGANVTGSDGQLSMTIPDGVYSGSKTAIASDSDLIAANIKSGVNIFGVDGAASTGASGAATGNATAADVLTGKTFSNGTSTGINGSMPDNGAVSITPGASAQTIAAGYHNGSGTVEGDADLTAANIKSGTNIFGVDGSVIEATGDATASNVLTGKTFSNASSASVNGSMPDNDAVTITPGASAQTIAAGYHNGSGTVEGDANLTAANIKKDVDIFGVTGTVIEATGDATASNVLTGKTFSNASEADVTGTMANHGGANITPGASDQTIEAGYHNGSGTVEGDADLTAGNIKKDIEIFGVTGTVIEATGDATASNVLTGKTFSNASSASVNGSMPDNGAVTITPSTSAQTIAAGYHNGSGTVAGDTDLIATNIKKGVEIFGVTGTVYPGPVHKTGQTKCYDQSGSEITCSGTGQDGDKLAGVTAPTPRFAESNGTITDNFTGLIWLKDLGCTDSAGGVDRFSGSQFIRDMDNALAYAAALSNGDCGLTDSSTAGDWRLPNIKELLSLMDYGQLRPAFPAGHLFTGTTSSDSTCLWSSTTEQRNNEQFLSVEMSDGTVEDHNKTVICYFLAVRDAP